MEREEVGVGRERTEEREESRHQHQVGASAISSWEGEGGTQFPFTASAWECTIFGKLKRELLKGAF